MIKGQYTFDEVEACVKAVGDEVASGWSNEAITVATLSIVSNWMAARVLSGASIEEETARLTDYLTDSVGRTVSEVQHAMKRGH